MSAESIIDDKCVGYENGKKHYKTNKSNLI